MSESYIRPRSQIEADASVNVKKRRVQKQAWLQKQGRWLDTGGDGCQQDADERGAGSADRQTHSLPRPPGCADRLDLLHGG